MVSSESKESSYSQLRGVTSRQIMVSIIVPVYNVANYLPKCVDSLLVQTYNDIEILLIDDGSTDGSGEIADQYAKQDNRIRTFHQPNGGISAARNKGLEVMRGDYVMFVDGDDYVSKHFCKAALDLAIKNQVDIVSFGYYTFQEQGGELELRATHEPRFLDKEQAIQELILRSDVMYNYAWNKFFKSQLFKDLRFPEGMTFEDSAIMHRKCIGYLTRHQQASISAIRYCIIIVKPGRAVSHHH